jgi:hypothetical protein
MIYLEGYVMVAEIKPGEILDVNLLATLSDESLEHASIQKVSDLLEKSTLDPALYNKIIRLFYKDCC